MDIIDRSQWGARAPRGRNWTSWGARREFVVHYSLGPTSQSPRSIQDFHMDGRGWSDIGYNFLVDVDGRIYEGRGWLVVGAHATGHNTSGIGVCFIGMDGDATDAARSAIRALYDEACDRAGRRLAMRGHRDVGSTSCPGDELARWVHNGMPADGGSIRQGGDPLIGLRKGDEGQEVKALQELCRFAGQGETIDRTGGSDGIYGDGTAEALRLVRESVGSRALEGFGDKVDGWAYSQLIKAVAIKQGGQ